MFFSESKDVDRYLRVGEYCLENDVLMVANVILHKKSGHVSMSALIRKYCAAISNGDCRRRTRRVSGDALHGDEPR